MYIHVHCTLYRSVKLITRYIFFLLKVRNDSSPSSKKKTNARTHNGNALHIKGAKRISIHERVRIIRSRTNVHFVTQSCTVYIVRKRWLVGRNTRKTARVFIIILKKIDGPVALSSFNRIRRQCTKITTM